MKKTVMVVLFVVGCLFLAVPLYGWIKTPELSKVQVCIHFWKELVLGSVLMFTAVFLTE